MINKPDFILTMLRYVQSFLVGAVMYCLFGMSAYGDNFPEIERLVESGATYLALEMTEAELIGHPKDRFLLETAVRLRFQIGDYESGEQHFRGLIENARQLEAEWLLLARLQEKAARWKEAFEAARKSVQLDSESSEGWAILARCLLISQRHEEVRDLLSSRVKSSTATAEELLIYGRALLRIDEFDEAAEILSRAISLPGSEPLARFYYGEALNGCRNYRQAADILSEVLEEEPFLVRAYYLLGTALTRMGHKERAVPLMTTYKNMEDLEDESFFWSMKSAGLRNLANYEWAVRQSQRGQYDQALSGFRRAAASRPDDGQVVLGAAARLAQMEAIVEAHQILDLAIQREVAPLSEFLLQKGELLLRAGQKEKARDWFQRALSADPNHSGALLRMGQLVFEERQHFNEAEAYLKKAEARAPDQWEPAYWLGRVFLEKGENGLSASYLRKAEDLLGGTNSEILFALGLKELRIGSLEEGCKLLSESLRFEPASPETLSHLETGLSALGDSAGAGLARNMREIAVKVESLLLKLRSAVHPFRMNGPAFVQAGHLYRELDSPERAVKYYRLARAASPDMAASYSALSELASAPEECFFRARNLANILRLSPRHPVASRNLALLYAQLGVRLERALELIQLSLNTDNSAEGRYVLGEVLFEKGDLKGASQAVRAALQEGPDDRRFRDLARRLAVNPQNSSASQQKE